MTVVSSKYKEFEMLSVIFRTENHAGKPGTPARPWCVIDMPKCNQERINALCSD